MEPEEHDSYEVWNLMRTPVRGRSVRRRCVSAAGVSEKARAWFSSPDRFLSPRAEHTERENIFRVSRSPESLSPRERRTRQQDVNADPFSNTTPATSQDAVRIRRSSPSGRHAPPHFTPSFVHGHEVLPQTNDTNESSNTPRQISFGAVWNVGGPGAAQGGPRLGVQDGRGGLLASGTNGPMYTAHFLDRSSPARDAQQHQDRLALALDIDRASRILGPIPKPLLTDSVPSSPTHARPLIWRNNGWQREEGTDPGRKVSSKSTSRTVPTLPFRVLDAPRLRDDFYCSTLAYSHTCRTLAVGLSSRVYLWSEEDGVRSPPIVSNRPGNYVTSLSFSSEEGGKAILAVGRPNGLVSLMSPVEERPRFQIQKSCPVSCLAFKPNVSNRSSSITNGLSVPCEDLLVGDDVGNLHYYSIEWPEVTLQQNVPRGRGTVIQLARIAAHSQQICGLAWSPDGKHFVSGGNDNAAHLFDVAKVLQEHQPRPRGRSPIRTQLSQLGLSINVSRRDLEPGPQPQSPPMSPERYDHLRQPSLLGRRNTAPSIAPTHTDIDREPRTPSAPMIPPATTDGRLLTPPISPTHPDGVLRTFFDRRVVSQPSFTPEMEPTQYMQPSPLFHGPGLQTHVFRHSAAVKAIAFAPWQPSLLATGGGSNDRQIHFFHTGSGATLALINVFAQVTSLIWSRTKREICATFGYAQPEHGVRIAVFAWPSGDCVVRIPWGNNGDGPGTNPHDPTAAAAAAGGGGRALWAVAFPGGPNDERRGEQTAVEEEEEGAAAIPIAGGSQQREGQRWGSRTQEEGCIVVASSDESVKFHEVWTGEAKKGFGPLLGLGNTKGVLGGSLILEASHGIEEELGTSAAREVIR